MRLWALLVLTGIVVLLLLAAGIVMQMLAWAPHFGLQ